MDCLEKLVECIAKFNKGEIDADTSCQIEKQILTDEIDDPELLNFAVEFVFLYNFQLGLSGWLQQPLYVEYKGYGKLS